MEQWQQIRHLKALGWSERRIAVEVGVDRRTVARAVQSETPPRYQREPSPSALAPWQARMEAGVRLGLRGSRVLEELQQAGYTGSRAAFYTHWQALVAANKEPTAACRFETDPGEQAQFDWAEYVLSLGGKAQKVYIYSLLLAYCRRVHWYPSLAVNQEAVFEGVEAGLWHFGGACRYLVIDNPKVFILRTGRERQWNPHFASLAGHYRFEPIACTPRQPQGKGKVENPFGHLEERFLRGSTWHDWDHFQQELAAFEARWETRVHGTTKVPPVERFREEQPRLLPLPRERFLGWHTTYRSVSNDCLISYEGVRYSVPWPYAGKKVLVRQRQGRWVLISSEAGKELAEHQLLPSGSPPVMLTAHYEGLRRRYYAVRVGLAAEFRRRYGAYPIAETYLQRLLGQHRHHPERPLQAVVELLSGVPESVAVAGLAASLEFNVLTPQFLAEQLRRQLAGTPGDCPAPPPPLGQLSLPSVDAERPLDGYGQALLDRRPPAA